MRTGFAAHATKGAAARRDTPDKAQAALTRLVSGLISVLLVLQLAGFFPHPGVRAAGTADAKTIALAGLAAAIGQPATLCDHDRGPSRPGDPADRGSCAHCIFCHSVAADVSAAPSIATGVARVAVASEVEPRAERIVGHVRHRGGATPRGPPFFG